MKKIILILMVFLSFLYSRGPSLVEVEQIRKAEVNPLQEFVGNIEFSNSSNLASQTSGLVEVMNFETGKKVKKGDILVKVDSDLLDTQITAAKANVEIAKVQSKLSLKDYDRFKSLLETKSITQKEFEDAMLQRDSAVNNLKVLEANLKELQIEKNRKMIRAPYDGIMVEKTTDVGEWVSTGTQIGSIINTSSFDVLFNVPENIFYGLSNTSDYELKIGEKTISAKLYSVIPDGDRLTRTFPVKFKASTKDMFIFDGQEAKIKLSKREAINSLTVSRDTVIKRFGQEVVFFVDDKMMANMIPVKVLGYAGNMTAIQGPGLAEGMQVVKKGNERVFPNSPVKILNSEM